MTERPHILRPQPRREWLRNSQLGFGMIALAGMLNDVTNADTSRSEFRIPQRQTHMAFAL